MSINLPIVWLDKINSPELLAFLQQYGHEHYLSAEEINLLRDAINELYATIEVLETEIARLDNADELIFETGFSLVGQNLTLNSSWEWSINGILYTNIADVVLNIAFAATGMQRIDLIVMNTSNTFIRIQGIESASNPSAPNLPVDTVQATLILVTDGVINEPAAAITGSSYVAKAEFVFTKVNGTGNKAAVSILDDSASFRFIEASGISSLLVSNVNKKFLYPGKKHYIKNDRATGTLTIFHNSGTGNYKYFFPGGVNMVLQVGQIAEFMVRFTSGNNGFLDYIGVAGAAASGGADTNYVYAQGTPSLTWNVAHNLNKFPSVIVVDSAKTEIGAQVDYVDANNIIITINAAASGYVYVN